MRRHDRSPTAFALALSLVACAGDIKVLPPTHTGETASPDDSAAETGEATDSGDTDESGQSGDTSESGTQTAAWSLLSLNLHCLKLDGTDLPDNDARFAAIADLVASEDVAALTAAELCDDGETDAAEALRAAIEEATGTDWSVVSTFAHTGWAGTEDEAAESVGVFTRGEPAASGSLTYAVQGGLNRVATWATLSDALGGVTVWSVHLDVDVEAARVGQAKETANAALVQADPSADVLVAGDFNDVEASDTHAAMTAAGFLDASDGLGEDRIDHVFAHRGALLTATSARLAFQGDSEPVVSDHPGVLVRLEPGTGDTLTWTRVTATADVDDGHFLSLRGDATPLSWDVGWPMTEASAASWRWVSTELPEGTSFAYKTLIDDRTWQSGDNSAGQGGQDNAVTPGF